MSKKLVLKNLTRNVPSISRRFFPLHPVAMFKFFFPDKDPTKMSGFFYLSTENSHSNFF